MEKIKGIETRKNKKGTRIYFRVSTSINGKLIRGAWCDFLEDAQKELQKYLDLRVELPKRNQHTKVKNDLKIEQFLKEYYEYAKEKYSVNYVISSQRRLDKLLKEYLPYPVSEISKIDLIDKIKGVKKSTGKVTIALLGSLNNFADEKEYPFKINVKLLLTKIKNFPASRERISFLTANEVKTLYSYLEKNGKYKSLKKMITISMYNGLRIGEILALRTRSIDLEKKIIHVVSTINLDGTFKQATKNGETRSIPMSKNARMVFEEILKENPDLSADDLFFSTSYSTLSQQMRVLRKEKILHPDYTFHTFRHTFASLFFKIKGTQYDSLLKLQQIMGHNDIQMSLKYVHLYDTYNKNILEDLSFNGAEKLEEQRKAEEKETYLGAVIKLEKLENKLHLVVPYDKKVVIKLRKFGKWGKEKKIWKFDLDKENEVRRILKEHFGYEEKQSLENQLAEMKEMLNKLLSSKR